jgi:type II secretory pathway pseudopilin PulG
MQNHTTPPPRGLSILELLLVLVVMAAILVTTVGRYQSYKRERDLNIIRENVALVYQTLLLHYASNCTAATPYNPTMSNFDDKKDLNYSQYQALLNKLIYIPLAPTRENYQVAATRLPDPPASPFFPPPPAAPVLYQLSVLVTLPIKVDDPNAAWYGQALAAAVTEDKITKTAQLIFTYLPNSTVPTLENDTQWIPHSNLGYYKRYNQSTSSTARCAF